MIGAIIGDIVGSRFEYNNIKSKEFELFTDDCFFTDDTVTTLAVAKIILESENEIKFYDLDGLTKKSVFWMQEVCRKYPNSGYGGLFYDWVFKEKPEPYNSFGNGSAMRISPVVYIHNEPKISFVCGAITHITHSHEQGMIGAEVVCNATKFAEFGSDKKFIEEYVSKYYDIDFALDEIRDSYKYDVTCQGTVPVAIKAFLESCSFEDAIRNAISIGGDSDTIAAITGSIAGAYYGVPEEIEKKALEYLDDYLLDIYHKYDEQQNKWAYWDFEERWGRQKIY